MMVMNAMQLMIEAEKQTTSIHQTTGLTGSSLLSVFLKLYGMFWCYLCHFYNVENWKKNAQLSRIWTQTLK